MPRNLSIAVVCLAASGWIAPAAAQAIYRCGDTYSQQACAGGTRVQAEDPRSADQRSQTSAAAERDAKAADAMEKARLKAEGKPAQAYIPPPKVQQDAAQEDSKSVKGAMARKPANFTAVSPRKPGDAQAKKKKKAKKKAA